LAASRAASISTAVGISAGGQVVGMSAPSNDITATPLSSVAWRPRGWSTAGLPVVQVREKGGQRSVTSRNA
jgi:hypothetical protein